jgi:tetratricopeptide (TPR) repeat protein
VTSPAAYQESNDVVRVKGDAVESASPVESFMIAFQNVKPASMDLVISWDKTIVTLPIIAEVDGKVMAQIDELMKTPKPPYFLSAMYYYDNGKDLNKALGWMDKAIEENPKAFWIYHYKANTLAKLGKKKEASDAANKSIELAKEARNDDYVELNQKLLATLK